MITFGTIATLIFGQLLLLNNGKESKATYVIRVAIGASLSILAIINFILMALGYYSECK